MKLPELTNRSWKISVREAVRAASDKPDEACKWVQEVYDRAVSMKLEVLDTRHEGPFSPFARRKRGFGTPDHQLQGVRGHSQSGGRQVLLMFEHYFKSNEEAGSLHSIEDLLKVQLNWESVIAGLNHQPEETTLKDICENAELLHSFLAPRLSQTPKCSARSRRVLRL